MADETTVTLETTSEETAKTIEAPGAENTETSTAKEGEGEKTFTQADIDRIVKDRLDKAQKVAEKKAADAQAKAEAEKAVEQGEFKTLYETEKAAREKAEAEKADIERQRLMESIANKHKLPDGLRDRLRGETAEELEADAKELAKTVKVKPDAPDLNAQNRGENGAVLTADEIKQSGQMLGVKYLG